MEVYVDLAEVKASRKLVIALGTFDGIHLGHQRIIRAAEAMASSCGGEAAVLSFSNHPLSVVAPELVPQHILNGQEKRRILSELGVKTLLELPFTAELAQMTADGFVSLLTDRLPVAALVVGENFTFGRGAAGKAELLYELGRAKGFEVRVCPTVQYDGEPISSTRLRAFIKSGDLAKLNECLGRGYSVFSEVVHGYERGRKLGFPTANFSFEPNRVLLPDGAYAVRIDFCGKTHYGMANIGKNPTFEEEERRLEVHIFDFAEDIYGKLLKVSFTAWLRGEKKFSSVAELVAQINKDKATARKLFFSVK